MRAYRVRRKHGRQIASYSAHSTACQSKDVADQDRSGCSLMDKAPSQDFAEQDAESTCHFQAESQPPERDRHNLTVSFAVTSLLGLRSYREHSNFD